jgi:hypothetical protein
VKDSLGLFVNHRSMTNEPQVFFAASEIVRMQYHPASAVTNKRVFLIVESFNR